MECEDGEVDETSFERCGSSPLIVVNRSEIDRLVREGSGESCLLSSREGGESREVCDLEEVGGSLLACLSDNGGHHHLEEREEEFENDLEPSCRCDV